MVVITDNDEMVDDAPSSTVSKTISQESKESTDCLTEEHQVQMFSKQMLQNKLFVGHYLERRLVEFIGTYRDVVVVHKSEVDLKRDLDSVRTRLDHFYDNIWIGITGPRLTSAPAGVVLWVKLHDLPFGHYWFQIKQVKFREREINLRIKMIRALAIAESLTEEIPCMAKTESQQSTPLDRASSVSCPSAGSESNQVVESVLHWKHILLGQIMPNLISYITLQNVRNSIFFITAFIMATLSGMVYGVRYAGEFSLRFLREMSLFLNASTPIILGVIEFFSKVVGGLYLLLAMMWRGTANNGASPHPNFRTTTSYVAPYVTPYPYRPKPIMPPLRPSPSKIK